jgi:phosphatidylserine/phosphatidylglycerophosphate/cardiolipin synthase-like enzyme
MRCCRLLVVVLFALGVGCDVAEEPAQEPIDGIDDVAAPGGKADSPYTDCQLAQVVAWVNDPATNYDALRAAGVAKLAAKGVIAHRDGADGQVGTADDDPFADLAELDAVPYVGPIALGKLVAAIDARCQVTASADVVFSPQPYEQSHLARVTQLINGAQRSIDLALYSFSDAKIAAALGEAVKRGVSVRLLFEPANADHGSPAGTLSAKYEDLGVDVRYVNKIMHHKFAIIDGPREDVAAAATAWLVTGSGNWSNGAGTKYDENTIFLQGRSELVLRFQREFNLLWESSRDLVWNQRLATFSSLPIDASMIPDESGVDAVFTSANFTVRTTSYGPTFSVVSGMNTVADRLVGLIEGAQRSIHLASGHLRSYPVAQALLAQRRAHPEMDIRIYLDGQEYISASTHASQASERAACIAAAGSSAAKVQACIDNNYYYSYEAHQAGIPLKFKYYAYRWDASYALQMHHKYLVIDGTTLASGSYNLSDNAEHATMENMVIYDGPEYRDLVQAFEANFESMWKTGGDAGLEALRQRIEDPGQAVPLVFDPLALDHAQVTALKALIRAECPAVDSQDYRIDPPNHRICPR